MPSSYGNNRVQQISTITGLSEDLVALVLKADTLVLCNNILHSQLSSVGDDTPIINHGVLTYDVDNDEVRFTDEFKPVVDKIIKDGYDPLELEMSKKFTNDLSMSVIGKPLIGGRNE